MVAERGKGSRKKKKKRVGLSRREEDRIKERMRPFVPSEYWIDLSLPQFTDSVDGEEIVYRFHDATAFPPQADDPKCQMRQCPKCGREIPAPTFEQEGGTRRVKYGHRLKDFPNRELCADCRPRKIHQAHGRSPSAIAIQRIRDLKLRIEEMPLESEKKSDLKREIQRANKSPNLNGGVPLP